MWKTVDNDETGVFLVVVIALGVVNLPELRDYWSTSKICQVPHPTIMPLNRFEMTSRYIHLCNNSKESPSNLPDHFANLETLINFLVIFSRQFIHQFVILVLMNK